MKELWRWLREVGNGTIPFCMQRQLSKNLPRLKAWQSWAKLLSSLIDGKKTPSVNEQYSPSSSDRVDVSQREALLPLFSPCFGKSRLAAGVLCWAWCGTSLWSLRVTCPGCVPSLSVGEVQERALCKPCSAGTETSLCYQHCCQHKSKTQPCAGFWEEN